MTSHKTLPLNYLDGTHNEGCRCNMEGLLHWSLISTGKDTACLVQSKCTAKNIYSASSPKFESDIFSSKKTFFSWVCFLLPKHLWRSATSSLSTYARPSPRGIFLEPAATKFDLTTQQLNKIVEVRLILM